MKHKKNVLIIEDHPIISEAYKNALIFYSLGNKKFEFCIEIADNCELAYKKIKKALEEKAIDIFFLDIRLPKSNNGKILSGEDLGLIINRLLPDARIIVSTMYADNHRINNILKNINPLGFLIKSDIASKELNQAIDCVMKGQPYYSTTILELLRIQLSNNFILDKIDRELLYQLSINTKTKDLPNILPLSKAGVEKRKRHLMEVFEVKEHEDKDLILRAKQKGFI